jgi:hypothetical protein
MQLANRNYKMAVTRRFAPPSCEAPVDPYANKW